MNITTWVFCDDCFKHDPKYHEIPNFMTSEVNITKAVLSRDTLIATFNCSNCKEQGRQYKDKESPIDISADQSP